MPLPITTLYLGLMALLLSGLSIRVSLLRMSNKVSMGDGEAPELRRAIRAFGNCIEYAPILLAITAGVEASGAPAWVVHLFGAGAVLTRAGVSAALSRSARPSNLRFFAMIATHVLLVFGGLGLLGHALLRLGGA